MALQLILGGSGAGKSHYLYNKIIRDSEREEKTNFLVLVPEQFTMETQKDFIKLHPRHGIMNIDVLSFMRLAYRILEETGKGQKPILEDIGKTMILHRVLEEKKGELLYFKSNIKKPGFVDEVKSMLSELYQYSIEQEQLEKMIKLAEKKPMLQSKLRDLLVIYKGFKEFIKERYITSEEIMDALYIELDQSEMVKDCVIVLDGFTGFTPSQYKVLEKLLFLAKKVYVTVTIDERESTIQRGEEHQLFHLSKTTIYKLRNLALDLQVELLDSIYPPKEGGQLYRFKENNPLGALEQNLFRFPFKPYEEKQEVVHIHALQNPKAEVMFVVHKMKSLIRKNAFLEKGGYRYRDFAVVTGDMGNYGRLMEGEFSKNGIPYFLDEKRSIEENPFVIMIDGILETAERGMDYESMFYFLRAGMNSLKKEEIDQLDNYVLALGIRGFKRWEQPFERLYKGQSEEDLQQLNEIRERIMEELAPLYPILTKKKQTVREYAENLYQFIVKGNVFERLQQYQLQFEKEGLWLKAKEYGQVYPLVMNILEDLVTLLGNEVMTLREIRDLLKTGFRKAKVGLIPAGIDQVMVGDIERTRLKEVKVLFFIGVNDGIVPKSAGGGGILSDSERELLKEKQVELAPTRREKIYREQFYLYLNLTKPENELYLTFCNVGNDGKSMKPSYLIGKITQLFKNSIIVDENKEFWQQEKDFKTKDIPKEEFLEKILANNKGIPYLLAGLEEWENNGNTKEYWKLLYSWYMDNETVLLKEPEFKEWKDHLLKCVFASCHYENKNTISKAVAKALYGEVLFGSVTRLELFAACAAAHFFRYGLRIKERQEFKINVPDMGNIFHHALELFSKKMEERHLSWGTITEAEREALGEECVKIVTEDYGNSIFYSSKRNEALVTRITRILKRTLWAISKQLSAGSFIPGGYELSFSYLDYLDRVNVPLEHGRMQLSGQIDRMDLWENGDKLYVKVVDYKSGKKTFDLVDLYYGFQLQLVVYMGMVLEKNSRDFKDKDVIPAGIFYYSIDDPMVDKTDELFLEDAILKELKVNGLVNEGEDVLKALDSSFQGESGLAASVKSTVIPVETLKDGMLSKNSSVAKTEDFHHLISYVEEKLISLGNRIMEGETERTPYRLGEKTPCEYCSYEGICGFDRKLPGNEFRILEKKKKEDIWREIRGRDEVDQRPAKGN